MTTNAAIGFGTLFQLSVASVFTTLGEVTSITMPNLARDAVDATHTESTGGWREFIPGLKDPGEVKIEMNFDPDGNTDQIIRDTFDSDSLQIGRIVFPSPSSPTEGVEFDCIVTGYEVEVPLDDKMGATLTLKVSGAVRRFPD
jgi:predicted secreted protein